MEEKTDMDIGRFYKTGTRAKLRICMSLKPVRETCSRKLNGGISNGRSPKFSFHKKLTKKGSGKSEMETTRGKGKEYKMQVSEHRNIGHHSINRKRYPTS